MFDDILGKVKGEGFIISEIITDKNSSSNTIFCHHDASVLSQSTIVKLL